MPVYLSMSAANFVHLFLLAALVDSTGLKIYGEASGKYVSTGRASVVPAQGSFGGGRACQGCDRCRGYTVDWQTVRCLRTGRTSRSELEQIDADGAYDTRQAYAVAAARETRLVVPPREKAVLGKKIIHGMRVLSKWPNGKWRNGRKIRLSST